VRWQGRNSRNKLTTVAVTNTTAVPFGYSVLSQLLLIGSPVLTDAKKPFVGADISAILVLTDGTPLQQAMCASPDGLTTVNIVGPISADP
jgi:hypothetical protein